MNHDIMRIETRDLSVIELALIEQVKTDGAAYYELINALDPCREVSLAKTKIEEAVMWAIKGITRPLPPQGGKH